MQKLSDPRQVLDSNSGQIYCVSFVGNPDDNLIRLTPVDDEVALPSIPGIEPVGPENRLPASVAESDSQSAATRRAEEVRQWQKQFFTVFIVGALVLTIAVLAIGWISVSAAMAQTPIGSLEDVARRWDILYVRTWPLAFALMALGVVSLLFSPRKS